MFSWKEVFGFVLVLLFTVGAWTFVVYHAEKIREAREEAELMDAINRCSGAQVDLSEEIQEGPFVHLVEATGGGTVSINRDEILRVERKESLSYVYLRGLRGYLGSSHTVCNSPETFFR